MNEDEIQDVADDTWEVLRADLVAALARVEALEAERDAAYEHGVNDGIDSMRNENADLVSIVKRLLDGWEPGFRLAGYAQPRWHSRGRGGKTEPMSEAEVLLLARITDSGPTATPQAVQLPRERSGTPLQPGDPGWVFMCPDDPTHAYEGADCGPMGVICAVCAGLTSGDAGAHGDTHAKAGNEDQGTSQ
jgi:hypothetical protein